MARIWACDLETEIWKGPSSPWKNADHDQVARLVHPKKGAMEPIGNSSRPEDMTPHPIVNVEPKGVGTSFRPIPVTPLESVEWEA